jgi:4-hydroxybenzoate polyprenyltransferase
MSRHRTAERPVTEVPTEQDRPTPSEAVTDRQETRERVALWNPAQIVALVIGGSAIVVGVIALIRTGLNTDHWYTPVASVLGIEHTPVLALAQIGFGVLMVFSAMGPGGRPLMALLSAIALVFGILVVADAWSASFAHWFAVRDANGWVYVIAGAVGLLSATMMPTVYARDRSTVTERHQVGRPHTAH